MPVLVQSHHRMMTCRCPGSDREALPVLLIKHNHRRAGSADYQTGRLEGTRLGWEVRGEPTCVQHTLDDHGHLAFQHGVEQLDNEDEAGAEHQQGHAQQDEAHRHVREIGVRKDMTACNGTVKTCSSLKCSLTLALVTRLLALQTALTMGHLLYKC